jgi:hypothetical protein
LTIHLVDYFFILRVPARRIKYAKRRDWTITERISEIGSGKDDNRPKREELLKKAYRR